MITASLAPWLIGGPYRLYETPQPGQTKWPTYYADWLTVPGYPEFDGQFFNCYSEARDLTSCAEWCPDGSDVAGSIQQAVQIAKRTLDSMVLTTLFTHESSISPISSLNWQAMLQGITNSLADYNPSYVTLDYASQYVRATRTSRLVSSDFDSVSGQVTVTLSGRTDLDTSVYVFFGEDNAIASSLGNVPAFSAAITNAAVVGGPPTIINAPSSQTHTVGATAVFSVGAAGGLPLSYQWYWTAVYIESPPQWGGLHASLALSKGRLTFADCGRQLHGSSAAAPRHPAAGQGGEPGSGLPHERSPDPVALGGTGNMKVVDEGAPLGIVGAVRADEAHQVRAIEGQLDELIAGRIIEPRAPHPKPFLVQVSVEERVEEGTPIVLTPATGVKRRDGLPVRLFRLPVLDHLPRDRWVVRRRAYEREAGA